MPLCPGSRTLSLALLWSWTPALAVGSADGRCAADGQCSAPVGRGATRGSAFVQLKTSLGAKAARAHGERRMLKFSQGQLVLNSTEALLQTGTTRACTESEKADFLSAHNAVRCMHGSPPVVWSDAVAASANAWASPLTSMRHSDSYNIAPPAGPAGENLYMSSAAGSSPKDVVSLWYNEVKDCEGGPRGFTDGCYSGVGGKATGHFTALIWRGVKEIGCAWSNDGRIALCRYKADDVLSSNTPNMLPQSNYVAQVPTKVKSLAQCSASSGPSPTPSPPASTPSPPAPTPSPSVPTPSPPSPTPASSCQDSSTYADPFWGAGCTQWTGLQCSGYVFSANLEKNCPVACGTCTPSAPAPTPAPPTPAPPTPAPPTPAPPTPAPPTPAPTPAPVAPTPAPATPTPAPTPAPVAPAPTPLPGAGADQCVAGIGSGGCVLQSSGCEGQVSFTLKCTHTGGQEFQFQLSMPDDYSWDLNAHCSQCFDIQVI